MIFLHIQKTSGTTFKQSLVQRFNLQNTSDITYHDRLMDKGLDWIGNRQTYSFLRDPYSWYKSYYSFLKRRLNHHNKTWKFINKEWSCIDFSSVDTFVRCMTEYRCKGFRISPFLQNYEGNPYIDYEDICKKYPLLGMYSITFLDFIRLQEDIYPINDNHIFLSPTEFYKHYNVSKQLNKSRSKEIKLSQESIDLINKYDLPTFELFKNQLSTNYKIF